MLSARCLNHLPAVIELLGILTDGEHQADADEEVSKGSDSDGHKHGSGDCATGIGHFLRQVADAIQCAEVLNN